MVVEDIPAAFGSSSAVSASWKSPLEMPLR